MGIYCLLCRAAGLAALAFAAGLGLSSSASAGAGHDEDEEIHCLALTIYYEARGEPQIGKLAVGHVVMNRARSDAFPDGVCDVVREGGARRNQCQFSWYCDGLSDRPRDAAALRESLRLAQEIYDGCTIDPSEGALFFHATSVRPAWRKWAGHGERIGRHVFYRGRSPAQLEPVSATADRCVEPAPPRNDTEVATRPIPPRGSQLTALPPALPALPRTR